MKKLSIKKISIFIIVVCIVVSIIYWQNRKNSFEYRKKQYIQELSCVPEKPIDKGIIYAEAMKQYWNWQMKGIWDRYQQWKQGDHPMGSYDASLDAERIKRECGLEENFWGKRWFSKDDCYPHIVMKNRTIKVYKPEQDDYLYKTEYHNKDVDFIVRIEHGDLTYNENCCKLLTYEEVQKEMHYLKKIKEKEMNDRNFFIYDIKYIRNVSLLSKLYFLRVFRDGYYQSVGYYPISQCGKVPYFTYF